MSAPKINQIEETKADKEGSDVVSSIFTTIVVFGLLIVGIYFAVNYLMGADNISDAKNKLDQVINR